MLTFFIILSVILWAANGFCYLVTSVLEEGFNVRMEDLWLAIPTGLILGAIPSFFRCVFKGPVQKLFNIHDKTIIFKAK